MPEPVSDPEITLVLAQAGREAKPLIGPEAAIPQADRRRAIGDMLPALLDTLQEDERNVLLTLVRMWRTLSTGEFVPKDVAAEWARPRLPAESVALVNSACKQYLGAIDVDWRARQREVRRVASYLRERVTTLL